MGGVSSEGKEGKSESEEGAKDKPKEGRLLAINLNHSK